jgi:hypothetical protein
LVVERLVKFTTSSSASSRSDRPTGDRVSKGLSALWEVLRQHTFAVNYLRKGGSVFHLEKVPGHSTLEMTRRYANLMTEDLQAVHQQCSLLAA